MCNDRQPAGTGERIVALLRVAGFFAVSAVWIPLVVLVALLRPGRSDFYPLARAWAGFALKWFGVRVEVEGAEHLEPTRDYVVLANHRSHFDPLAIIYALYDRETRWVAKRELERVPLFGTALRVTGQILIDRGDHEKAVAELRRHLRDRPATVVFFAEGHRAPTRALLPFKKGGVAFAQEAGMPVVPIAISGSERVLPRDTIVVRPGTIRVIIGRPIDAAGIDRDRLLAQVRGEIEGVLARVERREEGACGRSTMGCVS